MGTFGVLPMVKFANLLMVPLVNNFTNGNQKTLNSAVNGTIGTIGRSHGGMFVILIYRSHSFFFFFFFCFFLYIFSSCVLCYL